VHDGCKIRRYTVRLGGVQRWAKLPRPFDIFSIKNQSVKRHYLQLKRFGRPEETKALKKILAITGDRFPRPVRRMASSSETTRRVGRHRSAAARRPATIACCCHQGGSCPQHRGAGPPISAAVGPVADAGTGQDGDGIAVSTRPRSHPYLAGFEFPKPIDAALSYAVLAAGATGIANNAIRSRPAAFVTVPLAPST